MPASLRDRRLAQVILHLPVLALEPRHVLFFISIEHAHHSDAFIRLSSVRYMKLQKFRQGLPPALTVSLQVSKSKSCWAMLGVAFRSVMTSQAGLSIQLVIDHTCQSISLWGHLQLPQGSHTRAGLQTTRKAAP